MLNVVRHYTAVAVSQQAGPFIGTRKVKPLGMDPLVLIDATAAIMGHEEKELCKPGTVALCVILDTANSIMGSPERVRLSLLEIFCACSIAMLIHNLMPFHIIYLFFVF